MDFSQPGTSKSTNKFGPIFDIFEDDGGSSISAQPDLSQGQESDEEPDLDILNSDSDEEDIAVLDEFAPNSDDEENLTSDQLVFANFLMLNEIYEDSIDDMIKRVDKCLEQNRESQRDLRNHISAKREPGEASKSFFPLNLYAAPYFHDASGMIPELNEEAKEIMAITKVDLNFREPVFWKSEEEKLLKEAIKESIIHNRTINLEARKQLIASKLKSSGQETTPEQIAEWREEIHTLNRKILYIKSQSENEIFIENEYENVDWTKIANFDFKGTRTIQQIKQKWMYELDPTWNQDYWTEEEDSKLRELANKPWVSWDIIANKLGTCRSPWSCFVRFKRMKTTDRQHRSTLGYNNPYVFEPTSISDAMPLGDVFIHQSGPWTPYEDDKLISLVQSFKIGDVIPWAKVASFIPGRTKHMCEMRYTRSLDRNLKMGRWTEYEDLLLLNAVNKYGPRDWERIAENVPNRSSMQCRDRWINNLDYKRNSSPWTFAEDEKLFMGLKFFGKGNFSDIAKFIPGRNSHDVRMRLRVFTNYKIKASQSEENDDRIFLKNKTKLYEFFKERKESVHNKFKEIMESRFKNPDSDPAAIELNQRLGMGNYIVTMDGQQADYSKVFEKNKEIYGKAITITRRGRWKPIKKTVNEYDEEEILRVINKLPIEKQIEAEIFWNEIKEREATEQDQSVTADLDESLREDNIPPDRLTRLNELLDTVVTIEQSDLDYYNRGKKMPKPPKIEIRQRKRGPKPRRAGQVDAEHEETQSIDSNLLDIGMTVKVENSEMDPMYTIFDRNLADFEENIKMFNTQKEKRTFALKHLCMYLQELDDRTNLYNVKHNKLDTMANHKSLEYVSTILDTQHLLDETKRSEFSIEAQQPSTSSAAIESDKDVVHSWIEKTKPVYPTEALLHNVIPPNPATVQGFFNYMEERHNFVSAAHFLFDPVDDDLEAKTNLEETSHEVLDIRFSDELKTSIQYQLLRKRIFSTFMYAALLHYSDPSNERRLKEAKSARDLIEKRYQAEKEWIEAAKSAKQQGEEEPECPFQLYHQQEPCRIENPDDVLRASTPVRKAYDQIMGIGENDWDELSTPMKKTTTERLDQSIDEVVQKITEGQISRPTWSNNTIKRKRGRPRKNPQANDVDTPKSLKGSVKSAISTSIPLQTIPIDFSIQELQRNEQFKQLSVKDALKSAGLVRKRQRAAHGLYDHLFETAEKQAKLMEEQGVNFGKEEEIPVTILSDDEIPQQSRTNKIVLDDSQETVMTQLYELEDYEIEETPNLLTPGGPSEAVPSTSRDPFESDYE